MSGSTASKGAVDAARLPVWCAVPDDHEAPTRFRPEDGRRWRLVTDTTQLAQPIVMRATSRVRAYFLLTKPRVIELLLVTTLPAMVLAAGELPSLTLMGAVLLGGALAAGGNGRSAVAGLARLDGWPVAVLAGDPYFYGAGWTADASQKVTRFVDLADTFHLPAVHLVDNPGFVIGVDAERAATIRHGARALAAVYQATVPWCSVILRKVYGVAGAAHQNAARLKYRFAWPSGDWGSLPLAGGIEAAYKAQLEAADDPDAARAEIEQRLDAARSPFRTAEVFMIEEIVDPRDTRPLLCEFANLAAPLRGSGPTARGARP
jgi:hypothetical protein